jgi:MoaA/NifB/PqqE/SkfB family radical SAM enzyme
MQQQKYDAWLHWYINMRCNLDCSYCFFNILKKSAKIKSVDVKKIVKTLDETGKIFKIYLTGGGEPFLVRNIIEFCVEITKKHYFFINTNLTSNKFKEFADVINPERVIGIHASLHIEELFKKKLIEKFLENYYALGEKGFLIFSRVVAYPTLFEKADYYDSFFRDKGIYFDYEPYYGYFSGKKYPDSYTPEELAAFRFANNCKNTFYQKDKICNAGYNAAIVTGNGNVYPCYNVYQNLGNIYKKIKLSDQLIKCPAKSCSCPINEYDKLLFEKAMENKEINAKIHSGLVNYIGQLIVKSNLELS